MHNSFRLTSCPSPYLEKCLHDYNVGSDVESFFFKLLHTFEPLKHVALHAIPRDYISVFHSNPKLRIFFDLINNTQSNIIFYDCKLEEPCASLVGDLFEGKLDAHKVYSYILLNLQKTKIPLLLDTKNGLLCKLNCKNGCGHSVCSPMCEIPISIVDDIEKLNSYFRSIAKLQIDTWSINRKNLDAVGLKHLMFLLVFLFDVVKDFAGAIDKLFIHPDLIRDIQRGEEDISSIIFSIFRAFAYPGVGDPTRERHPFSVDWHINSPRRMNGHQLFRIDVVAPTRTGIKGSGKNRLLMTLKNEEAYFIAYTEDHDFSDQVIRVRTSDLSQFC